MDFGTPAAGARLHETMASRVLAIDILINDAGFGVYGDDLSIPWQPEPAMLEGSAGSALETPSST